MPDWMTITLGLALPIIALSIIGWKVWKLFERGRKDWIWIWQEANWSATYLWTIVGVLLIAEVFRDGITLKFWIYLGVGAIGTVIAYLSYSCGRLFGIWKRSKNPDVSP